MPQTDRRRDHPALEDARPRPPTRQGNPSHNHTPLGRPPLAREQSRGHQSGIRFAGHPPSITLLTRPSRAHLRFGLRLEGPRDGRHHVSPHTRPRRRSTLGPRRRSTPGPRRPRSASTTWRSASPTIASPHLPQPAPARPAPPTRTHPAPTAPAYPVLHRHASVHQARPHASLLRDRGSSSIGFLKHRVPQASDSSSIGLLKHRTPQASDSSRIGPITPRPQQLRRHPIHHPLKLRILPPNPRQAAAAPPSNTAPTASPPAAPPPSAAAPPHPPTSSPTPPRRADRRRDAPTPCSSERVPPVHPSAPTLPPASRASTHTPCGEIASSPAAAPSRS
ncbi:hypothetical protein Nocox_37930 [Nonomuraea coxensis DSM 45129]|uniref:Uncharacterized protein n=1 Tax=Nonomuraea coxensis DSM 45129 TaxID=1122611 RepID=A0ABX8UBH0_9ACTN|nr:hypothetical protein Nocox_37930 [Nonomuraea coxensis DSM 45129]